MPESGICPIIENADTYNVDEAHIFGAPIDQAVIIFETAQARARAQADECAKCQYFTMCSPQKQLAYDTAGQPTKLIVNRPEKIPREKAVGIFPNYTA